MVAPSKSFTVIADADIDPDSPVTTGLMNSYRDNDIHVEEWLGDSFVAAKDHDHDDVNSKKVAGANLVNLEASNTSSRTTGSAGFVDLTGATVTVLAADLTADRKALIICTLSALSSSADDGEVEINVAGSGTNTIRYAGGTNEGFAVSDISNLSSGANRIIKIRFRTLGGSTTGIQRSHLQVVLIT